MRKFNDLFQCNKGSSLVEVVLAFAIFALISSSLASLILGAYNIMIRDAEIAEGRLLANQGMEALRSISERAWNSMTYEKSAINYDLGYWDLTGEGTDEQIEKYTREILFFDVYRDEENNIVTIDNPEAWLDPASREVEVVVNWDTGFWGNYEIRRKNYLTNWNTKKWKQNDWSGQIGQAIWLDVDKYDSDDGNIGVATSSIMLKEIATSTYPLSGYFVSSAYKINEYENFNIIEWQATSTATIDCPICEIRVQIMSAPDEGGVPGAWTTTWSGPEGDDDDENDYFSEKRGELISADHATDQWIKYRVEFIGDGSHTPVLEEMRIRYN